MHLSVRIMPRQWILNKLQTVFRYYLESIKAGNTDDVAESQVYGQGKEVGKRGPWAHLQTYADDTECRF